MSATNATSTINLPLFIGTDKPAWLTDWNGAMNIIDSSIASLQTAEGGTATALATLSQSVTALSDTVSQHTTAIQTVTTATAGNTGSINTINSLIGNGTPTTTDKTLIGAINEINAKIPEGGVDAEDVTYDNTASGLTATNVQAAIDELKADVPTVKNNLGTFVDLASYTQASPYTAPEDGYIFVSSGAVSYALAVIHGATSPYTDNVQLRPAAVSSTPTEASTFIRKGMKVYPYIPEGSDGFVRFVPFA